MSSSPPQKLTFTSFKKEKVTAPQPSPAFQFGNERLLRYGFKSLVALNLGLSAYLLFKEPPRRRNVVDDADEFKPDVFPDVFPSQNSDVFLSQNSDVFPSQNARGVAGRAPFRSGSSSSGFPFVDLI